MNDNHRKFASKPLDPCEYLHTLRDFVRWGASQLSAAGCYFGHGQQDAIDEAAALTLHVLHLPNDLDDRYFDGVLMPDEKAGLIEFFRRRMEERRPLAYLTNQAWFMGLPFYVDERVLVPRSPMAELIEKHFAPWLNDPDEVEDVLDLCTGSGCIGIACAMQFPQARVDLVDIEEAALQVAQHNVEEYQLGWRVRVVHSDLFEACDRRYHLIVSNPPYVSEREMESLPEEYGFEPASGLVAGPQGLDIVSRMLFQASDYLHPGGLLVVEVGATWQALAAAYPQVPFLWLDLDHGGEGIFMMSCEQLKSYREVFRRGMAQIEHQVKSRLRKR